MDKKELQKRFKSLAIKTGKLCINLPFNPANKVYIDQIIRSSIVVASINTLNSNIVKEASQKIRNLKSKT